MNFPKVCCLNELRINMTYEQGIYITISNIGIFKLEAYYFYLQFTHIY